MTQNEAVRAWLLDRDGNRLELPPLRAWDILRTDGDGCDAITLSAQPVRDADALSNMCGVCAERGGRRIFTGLVDELELSRSLRGTELTVHGRGNAARLTDNQTPGRGYARLTLAELLRSYVQPLGIRAVDPPSVTVTGFSVSCGSSVMQLLQGFCAHTGLLAPMFDAQGRLLLRKKRPVASATISQEQVRSAVWRDKRYGVCSRVELRHTRTGQTQVARYPAFLARGGRCERFGLFSGEGTDAQWRDAQQRIEASRREEFTLELTVEPRTDLEPGTLLGVTLPCFGVEGRFLLHETRLLCDGGGSRCVLKLRKE